MKLDELSKQLYEEINYDSILDPDLTLEEQEEYYQNILEESKTENNKEKEDVIIQILNNILESGDLDE